MTGSGFNREVDGVVRKFGVSGYLYNSDVLLWDDCGESFWSQVEGAAVAGPETGKKLEWLDVLDTTWADFEKRHPKGKVLKGPLNRRAYAVDTYKARGYHKQDTPGFLGRDKADKRMHQKATVTGVTVGDKAFCVPHDKIKAADAPVEVEFAGETLVIEYDEDADFVIVKRKTEEGEEKLITMRAYWFAWAVFHPETEVYGYDADEEGEKNPEDKPKEKESEDKEEGF